MATRKHDSVVDPVNVQVGGDADFHEIAQPVTMDERRIVRTRQELEIEGRSDMNKNELIEKLRNG